MEHVWRSLLRQIWVHISYVRIYLEIGYQLTKDQMIDDQLAKDQIIDDQLTKDHVTYDQLTIMIR